MHDGFVVIVMYMYKIIHEHKRVIAFQVYIGPPSPPDPLTGHGYQFVYVEYLRACSGLDTRKPVFPDALQTAVTINVMTSSASPRPPSYTLLQCDFFCKLCIII